ncbi:unnamed protein product [Ectocarpus sp. 12 AP-2014]
MNESRTPSIPGVRHTKTVLKATLSFCGFYWIVKVRECGRNC